MQTLNENSTKIEEEDQEEIPGRYEDFIGIYDNALSPEFCDGIIEAFDHYHRTNAVWCENDQFENTIAGRFDWAIDLSHMAGTMLDMPERSLNDVLMSCFNQYINKYGHLSTAAAMYSTTQKIQKTPAGGG